MLNVEEIRFEAICKRKVGGHKDLHKERRVKKMGLYQCANWQGGAMYREIIERQEIRYN